MISNQFIDWEDRDSVITFTEDPERERDVLLVYLPKDIEIFISGHGNICSKERIKQNIEYLETYFITAN